MTNPYNKIPSRGIINQVKKIKNLESVGRPRESWVLSNRNILMSQINPGARQNETPATNYYFQYFSQTFNQMVLRPALVALLVVGVYFSYTATVMTAKASLPGEALYPLKILTERMQIAAAIGDEAKVKLKMDFVSRRGDELQQLVRIVEDDQSKIEKISQTVKNITQEVNDVKKQLDSIITDSSAASAISTAKVIDEKTLKVEKDIVDAHAVLTTEVKKEVAQDVKDAIVKAEEVGTKALTMIIDKSDDQQVKDSKDAVTDQELTSRITDRIKNTEASVEVMAQEVNRISTSTTGVAMDKVITSIKVSDNSTTTLSEAVKNVNEAPKQAQDTITAAKDLLEKKDFTSALQKIQETKVIVADAILKAPIIDDKIKTEAASSTAAMSSSTASSTKDATSTSPAR